MSSQDNLYIFGKKPVEEVLLNDPKKIEKIYFKDGSKGMGGIQASASELKIPYSFVPEKKLSNMTGKANHQGVVAVISGVDYEALDSFLDSIKDDEAPAVLVLDEIEDPHNVGAMIRTAVASGIRGVILGKHNQVGITGTVYKTSAGLVSQLPIVRVSNINDALRTLKKNRFWVGGLVAGEKSFWETDLKGALAIVVGNEGEGIRHETLKLCDFAISIPMAKGAESLNASVAAALAMYEWKRQNT